MNRRHFVTVFCMGAISASMAVAASYEDAVISQLRSQGYKKIVVERTLLGRVKISAVLKGGRREIILNPRTGEVLRDLWIGPDGDMGSTQIVRANSGDTNGSGSGNGGGDDNGGDDTGDDDNGGDDNDSGEDSDSGDNNDDNDDNESDDNDGGDDGGDDSDEN